jgi:NADP-dependent aldehyde dehydrogenase
MTTVDRAAESARTAFPELARTADAVRATWLRAVAEALDAEGSELIPIAADETALSDVRLRGEIARTTGQLRLFADVLDEGSYLEATIDHAVPDAIPPRPDLRRMLRPLGPVAVFAASNFPFAFSIAGGDTASALAVGCPVVVKAHPGHPALSRLTARIVEEALRAAGAPDGAFAMVEGYEAGVALIEHPAIAAAAFTGSVAGGRALHDRAALRPEPIPFFGELGSLNPVVVTAAADAARGEALAAGLATSFQLGSGQFCTKPGLVLVPVGSTLERQLPGHVGSESMPMLTESIGSGFRRGLERALAIPGVEVIAGRQGHGEGAGSTPVVLATDAATLAAHGDILLDEVFGPVTLLVRYRDDDELLMLVGRLEGSLTATLHAEPADDTGELLERLERRAGRLLFAGWPTGVAVAWAQHHGGPWPATTSQHTSVGATAVRRFLRPLAYQDAPESALPAALRESNPLGIPRRVDGVLRIGKDR